MVSVERIKCGATYENDKSKNGHRLCSKEMGSGGKKPKRLSASSYSLQIGAVRKRLFPLHIQLLL
jgi:hypothetical protein